jgi:hypothetical protein
MGIPILLHRLGAAANDFDFPLNSWYKFSSVEEAFNKACIILQSLDGHVFEQKNQSHLVRGERTHFFAEVIQLVGQVSNIERGKN